MVHGFKFRPQVPKSGVTYWRNITLDGLVSIIPPKRNAVPLFGRHVVVSYILSYPQPYSLKWYTASNSGHRSPNLGSPTEDISHWTDEWGLSRQNETLYHFLDDMLWWAIYWAIHSHIAESGTRLQIPATGPQIWGHLLTKYHIWRISEDYPAKTKRCTTFWMTCRGELYIELSTAI